MKEADLCVIRLYTTINFSLLNMIMLYFYLQKLIFFSNKALFSSHQKPKNSSRFRYIESCGIYIEY
jgi:hypothetical protein